MNTIQQIFTKITNLSQKIALRTILTAKKTFAKIKTIVFGLWKSTIKPNIFSIKLPKFKIKTLAPWLLNISNKYQQPSQNIVKNCGNLTNKLFQVIQQTGAVLKIIN